MTQIMLPIIQGDNITFTSIYKHEFATFTLKDEVTLTPSQLDNISLASITKFKIYNDQPIQNHYTVKIVETKNKTDQHEHMYAVSKENHKIFFEKLMMYKMKSLGLQFDEKEPFENFIEDDCLKKSQFLGNWERRHIRISKQTGLSSKKLEADKQSLHINTTKQIWTRFELLENNKFIVFKVKYLLGKQQFAIPIKFCMKWIKALYSLYRFD